MANLIFEYQAIVKGVHDADTITVDVNLASLPELRTLPADATRIDLGFSIDVPLEWAKLLASGEQEIWRRDERIRFYGLNAPEIKDKSGAGIKARDYVRSLLPVNSTITLQTIRVKGRTKQEKYGRYLGIIFLENDLNLNQRLIELGYAIAFML